MRAVLDPNILIAALLSPSGAPAQVVTRWLAGEFELVVSQKLLAELERALAYPKLRTRVGESERAAFMSLVREGAIVGSDRPAAAYRSVDPGDDYLLSLAEGERALLVSGDRHVLALADELPIYTARGFLESLEAGGPAS